MNSAGLAKVLLRMGNAYSKMNKFGEAVEALKHSLLEDNTVAVRNALRKAEADKKRADAEAYLDEGKSEEAKVNGNEAFKNGKVRCGWGVLRWGDIKSGAAGSVMRRAFVFENANIESRSPSPFLFILLVLLVARGD